MNPETVMERRGDGTVYIGGPGKVYKGDITLLLEKNEMQNKDLVDVRFGDEVTEIGFGVFQSHGRVSTLYLGKNVSWVNHGAMMDCDELEYVYLPSGIKRVGKDFLYRCASAYVVTDGAADDLPSLANIPDNRVLSDIHSYDDLVAARVTAKQLSVPASMMTIGKSRVKGDAARPEAGQVLSAGDLALNKGTYDFELTGEGLGGVTAEDISLLADDRDVAIRNVEASEDCVRFVAKLKNTPEELQFKLAGGDGIAVTELAAYTHDVDLPAALKTWWP